MGSTRQPNPIDPSGGVSVWQFEEPFSPFRLITVTVSVRVKSTVNRNVRSAASFTPLDFARSFSAAAVVGACKCKTGHDPQTRTVLFWQSREA